jgi:hypothetical protein|tara:strand:- start:727 stop:3327 length:2601 start_codon:yes stop_codon:yes gene_type:complete
MAKNKYSGGGGFPNQFVADEEKSTYEYGLRVGQAIESEWFSREYGSSLYGEIRSEYLNRRLYARGKQPIEKYKNELAINGDLSYLNLDWTPVPIIPKFVDIVVNGISNRLFKVDVEAVDQISSGFREAYRLEMEADMLAAPVLDIIKAGTGVDAYNFAEDQRPQSPQELDLYMKLSYKQGVEVAQETAIDTLLEINNYDEIKRRVDEDNVVLGISAVKHSFNAHEGVKVEYVDPINLVYSQTEDPNFRDCYYFGEVKSVHIGEIKKINPNLTQEEIEEISKLAGRHDGYRSTINLQTNSGIDKSNVSLLYFCYKTDKEIIYKVKSTVNGGEKALKKESGFNPPASENAKFKKVARRIDVWYEGVMVLGTNRLLKWQLMENQVRPKSAFQSSLPPYLVSAIKMDKGHIDSLVKRMIPFADQIQLVHLKLQQVVSKMIPDGVFIDADGLNSVDLGNGASYNPSEALSMYFQTGSVIGRSFTEDGEFNNARVPIQELTSSGSNAKIQSLITMYNYQLNMIRSVTGINEARDGSMPDKNALVGLQKLAALNSNTATRHVLLSGVQLTKRLCEAISCRISDILMYSDFAEDFAMMIGKNNFEIINEIGDMHLHDFGIFIELEPDEEEKGKLEQNIQQAIAAKMIDLSDAIDVREVKNYTLANQLLKIKKKRKEQADKRKNAENIQMQSQANQQAAQKASEGRMQESQLKTQSESELMQLKAQLELQKLEAEKQKDLELMQIKYEYEMKIKGMESKGLKDRETNREDRKDQRTELQATQQSELITQRKQGGPPKNFTKPKGNKLDMLKASGGGILGGSPSPTATAMPMQPPQQRETQAMPQMQPPTGQGAPPAQDEAMMNALMSKMQGGKNV